MECSPNIKGRSDSLVHRDVAQINTDTIKHHDGKN